MNEQKTEAQTIFEKGRQTVVTLEKINGVVHALVRELTKLPVLLGSYTGKSHKTR